MNKHETSVAPAALTEADHLAAAKAHSTRHEYGKDLRYFLEIRRCHSGNGRSGRYLFDWAGRASGGHDHREAVG